MPDAEELRRLGRWALAQLRGGDSCSDTTAPGLQRLLRHGPVVQLLAVDHIAQALMGGLCWPEPQRRLPFSVIQDVASEIARSPAALEQIRHLVRHGRSDLQPMVASILAAMGAGWRPEGWRPPTLTGARLGGVP